MCNSDLNFRNLLNALILEKRTLSIILNGQEKFDELLLQTSNRKNPHFAERLAICCTPRVNAMRTISSVVLRQSQTERMVLRRLRIFHF